MKKFQVMVCALAFVFSTAAFAHDEAEHAHDHMGSGDATAEAGTKETKPMTKTAAKAGKTGNKKMMKKHDCGAMTGDAKMKCEEGMKADKM